MLKQLLLLIALLGAPAVMAATYTIPGGPLPPGCSVAAGQVNCGSLTLNYGDVINVGSATTLNFSGNFNGNGNIFVNNGGSAANLTINVNGSMNLGQPARVRAVNTNVNGNVTLQQDTIITGNIASTAGSLTGNFGSQVTGNVTAAGQVNLGQNTIVGGNIVSLNNNVQMSSGTVGGYIQAANGSITTTGGPSNITGSLTAKNAISLGQNSTVGGSLTSATSTITLGETANITGSLSAYGNISIGQNSNVQGSVTSSNGSVTTNGNVHVYGNVTSSGNINLGQGSDIDGNVQSSAGSVTSNFGVSVGGYVDAAGNVNLGQATVVGQSVSSDGSVTLNYGVTTGSIAAGGSVAIAQAGVVNGSVTTTSGNVNLGYGAVIDGSVEATGDVNLSQNSSVDGNINTNGNVQNGGTVNGYVNSSNPTTVGGNVQGPTCNQNSNAGPCGSGGGPSVLYYRIAHTGSMLTCEPQTIQISACAVAGCGSTATISGAFTLTATGPTTANFNGSFTAAGTAAVAVSLPTAGNYTLSLSSTSPAATQAPQCQSPTGCALSSAHSGFTWQQAGGTPIPAQVAGQAFSAQLVPMNCAASIAAGNLNIEVTRICENPGPAACVSGDNLFVGGTSVTAGTETLAYNGSTVAVNTIRYDDAGAIRLRAVATLPSGAQLSGNSSVFVVKPHSIGSEFTAPAGSSYPSGVFAKAGEDFTAQLTARNAAGAVTPSFGKETVPEAVTLAGSAQVVAPVGGSGQLQIAPAAFVPVAGQNAVFRSSAVAYNDVGTARFTAHIVDGDYLGAGDVSTLSPVIGRFIPWAFRLDTATAVPACMANFTYMGQPQQLNMTLSARNAAGQITTNYPDGLAPLASAQLIAGDATQGVALDPARISASGTHTNWSAGNLHLTSLVTVAKLAAPDGPFNAFQLGVKVADNETGGPLSTLIPASVAAIPNCGTDCAAAGVASKLVYGRLFVADTYGPEDAAAAVNLEVQSWDTTRGIFLRLFDDSCTTVAPANLVALDSAGSSSAAGTPTTLQLGRNPANSLQWTAPATPLSFRFRYDAPQWLRFDASTAGYDAQGRPTARATFGRYRGHDRVLLWQQVPTP